jgi:predicted TIM-barrel fold metal-dependent hydrolase
MNFRSSKKWVDTHFHVFHAGEAVHGARYVPQYNATLSDWTAHADRVGVTHGVWVQPSFLGEDNRMLLQALQEHPDRLRGVVVVAPVTSPDALCTLNASGVRGIRLNLAGRSHDLAAWTQAEAVWQTMQALGWHLELHTDSGALPHVLAQLPSSIPLVLDHMAKPAQVHASDASIRAVVQRAKHSPTHIKLSGAYRLGSVDAASLAHLWLHELGVDAMLWGSDWPCTNHEQCADYTALFAQLQTWVGSQHLDAVLWHNPDRLYWNNQV